MKKKPAAADVVTPVRERLNFTQDQMAEFMAMSKSTVQLWGRGGKVRMHPLQRELWRVYRRAAETMPAHSVSVLHLTYQNHGLLDAVVFLLGHRPLGESP